MRVPLNWLREYVGLSAEETAREVAERLIRAGLEVETVDEVGTDLRGPLRIGRVDAIEQFTASNGKTIRWCQVAVDPDPGAATRGIICGATNFAVDDHVVVALPGAVLAGGLAISARRTYERISDGMICSPRELGLGDDHTGILVLPDSTLVGADAFSVLELPDAVLDIAVTPDRGYALSMRGIARETATAYGVPLRDPADVDVPAADGQGHQVVIEDDRGCDRFVARNLSNLDPTAASPLWLRRRLLLAGMRPVSLAVDVTNYVMLELGQPLHAYDRRSLTGPIAVRRARPGEKLETLDGTTRDLDPDDLVIADDSGPIGIAGVMGGSSTEISPASSDIVIEAAHFDPATVARASRRHKLSSEASRRFERAVDPMLPPIAAKVAAELLAELGGATVEGSTDVNLVAPFEPIQLAVDLPSRLGGRHYPSDVVRRRLEDVGCSVADAAPELLVVTPPSWRPDLTMGADLVEEVLRLEGYDTIPSVLPVAPAGRGLTREQRLRRRIGMALAGAGFAEVLSYPFVGPADWDALGLPADDERRRALRLANPLSEEEPELRTTLLPGLLSAARRNIGRGFSDLALYEMGLVYLPSRGRQRAPRPAVSGLPSAQELRQLDEALPDQPRHLGVVVTGSWEPAGWWGGPRPGSWADAVAAARLVARTAGAALSLRAADLAPWHPGRCAAVVVAGSVVGHAGELHPRVVEAYGLPARAAALELDLDAITAAGTDIVPAPTVSSYPVAKEDVALVVAADVPVAEVEAALQAGSGPLLESLRLFDVYTGAQVEPGHRSLAFALRFRAPDRTLTVDEVSAARDAAVAEAGRRTGAVLRGPSQESR